MSQSEPTAPAPIPGLRLAALAVGSTFVWFDFFLFVPFGALIGGQFLPGDNAGADYLFALFAVAAGLVMRPVGALVFGRMGDARGRAPAVLTAMLVMGAASVLVGLLPTRAQIGLAAPALLILLRLIQGFALGGAPMATALYVAETAPERRRGLYTGVIQAGATVGLALALGLAAALRDGLTGPALESWGWRMPFIASALLLALWAWLNHRLPESPAYVAETGRRPLKEAFGAIANLKLVLLVILGLAAGQAVVWQAAHLYALTFLENVLQTAPNVAEGLLLPALVIAAPFFLIFGCLSDKVGRKWVIMAGCALAAAGLLPLFQALSDHVQPGLHEAKTRAPIVLVADARDCSLLFDPVGRARYRTSCDVAREFLTRAGLPFKQEAAYKDQMAGVQVGQSATGYIDSFRGEALSNRAYDEASQDFARRLGAALSQEGYPAQADPQWINGGLVTVILALLLILVAMVTAPLAAMLAELFPARVRSTSATVAWQIGQAWVGGLMAPAAFALVSLAGILSRGLLYPVFFAALAVIVGGINLADRRKIPITD